MHHLRPPWPVSTPSVPVRAEAGVSWGRTGCAMQCSELSAGQGPSSCFWNSVRPERMFLRRFLSLALTPARW